MTLATCPAGWAMAAIGLLLVIAVQRRLCSLLLDRRAERRERRRGEQG